MRLYSRENATQFVAVFGAIRVTLGRSASAPQFRFALLYPAHAFVLDPKEELDEYSMWTRIDF
jgi:hypothetical protein